MMNTTLPLVLIIWILVAHYVSDWLLQSRKVAEKKGKDNYVLTKHVVIYMVGMFTCFAFYGPVGHMPLFSLKVQAFCEYILLNGLLHWATDWLTSRVNAWAWKNKRKKLFWSCIGFDQLLHYLALLFTATRLLS